MTIINNSPDVPFEVLFEAAKIFASGVLIILVLMYMFVLDRSAQVDAKYDKLAEEYLVAFTEMKDLRTAEAFHRIDRGTCVKRGGTTYRGHSIYFHGEFISEYHCTISITVEEAADWFRND